MKKWKVSIFMVLLMAFVLGACNGNDLEDYEDELYEDVANPILEEEDMELTLRLVYNEHHNNRISEMLNLVKERTGVEVVLDAKEWDGYHAILNNELSRSEMPHIVELTNPGYDKSFLLEETEHLLDLTDFLEESGLSEQFMMLDDFTIDGRVFGLPTMLSTTHLFYNKEIVEELGGEPKTWDELIERIDDAKRAGYSPIGLDDLIYSPFNLFEEVLQQTAGKEKLYDLMTGEAKWSDDEFIEAFEMMDKLKMIEVPLLDEDPAELFLSEGTVFIYDSAYMLALTKVNDELAQMQGNIGVMNIPSVSGIQEHQSSVRGSSLYGYVFSADVTEEEQQMIYQFIETFWAEDMMSDYYVAYDWLPPVRAEPVTTDELFQDILQINNEAETFSSGIHEFTSYAIINRDDKNIYDKKIRDVIYSFMYGNLSIQEAVEELQMHIDVLLQEQELSDFEIINTGGETDETMENLCIIGCGSFCPRRM